MDTQKRYMHILCILMQITCAQKSVGIGVAHQKAKVIDLETFGETKQK